VTEDHGTVIRVEGSTFVVAAEGRERRARRATSCLLEPAVGDLVLLATLPHGQSYVLAVLEREEGAPASLVSEGDLHIKVKRGDLGLAAEGGVRVCAGKEASVVSAAVQLRAADGHVAIDRLTYFGTFLRASVQRAKVFGQSFDATLERVSQRAKRAYRFIEEAEHVRAERIDYAAKSALRLHGETVVVTAEHLAKVDGDQIHVG
jgi:hypothetical protein